MKKNNLLEQIKIHLTYTFAILMLAIGLIGCSCPVSESEPNESYADAECSAPEHSMERFSIDGPDPEGLLAINISLPSADQEDHQFFSELRELFPECDQLTIEAPGDVEDPIYFGLYMKSDVVLCLFHLQERCI